MLSGKLAFVMILLLKLFSKKNCPMIFCFPIHQTLSLHSLLIHTKHYQNVLYCIMMLFFLTHSSIMNKNVVIYLMKQRWCFALRGFLCCVKLHTTNHYGRQHWCVYNSSPTNDQETGTVFNRGGLTKLRMNVLIKNVEVYKTTYCCKFVVDTWKKKKQKKKQFLSVVLLIQKWWMKSFVLLFVFWCLKPLSNFSPRKKNE